MRALIAHGEAPRDDEALLPPCAKPASDIVALEPGHHASVPLIIPVRSAGLARVIVAIDNDLPTIGDRDAVWTGTARFVWYVDVRRSEAAPLERPILKAARESAARPETLEGLRAEAVRVARQLPDDRAVAPLSSLAIAATDARVAHAALSMLDEGVARGGSIDAYGAYATIAADPERPRDLRSRAVDGLVRIASGRLTGLTEVTPQVREVSDVRVPPLVLVHVRKLLQALASDADILVRERARAGLAR